MNTLTTSESNTHTTASVSLARVDFMYKVYGWMALGLFVTAFTAYMVSSSTSLMQLIYGNRLVFYAILAVELILVIYISRALPRLSSQTAGVLFLIYALANGLTFSVIFLTYDIGSIGSVFAVTAGMFATISLYGYTTKKDLTSIGSYILMALVGLIIASVVNLFFANDRVALVLSYIGVIIFTALTAYDTQKIKEMSVTAEASSGAGEKVAIMGALMLYLDFINLFLDLLRIMGRRK